MEQHNGPFIDQSPERDDILEQLNRLREQKWDLLDQIEAVDFARYALLKQIRRTE